MIGSRTDAPSFTKHYQYLYDAHVTNLPIMASHKANTRLVTIAKPILDMI